MGPDDVARIWPLTGVSIGSGVETTPGRRVVRVDSDQGAFAAKVDDTPIDPEGDAESMAVLTFLNGCHFPHAPTLLRTHTNRPVARIGTSVVTVMEFIPRPVVASEEARVVGWSELGQAAARLNAHREYRHPFAIPVDRALRELADRAKDQTFEREFMHIVRRISPLAEAQELSLIHGEINEANALRRADGTIVFVDWDQAGTGPTVLECGYPLVTNFISEQDHAFDVVTAKAFYDGYRAAGGTLDLDQLFDAALFHALRYMWWGDTARRWSRIRYALANEDAILEQIV